jgi:hypothetical protein
MRSVKKVCTDKIILELSDIPEDESDGREVSSDDRVTGVVEGSSDSSNNDNGDNTQLSDRCASVNN